jgi:exodeoxyribonuclease-3
MQIKVATWNINSVRLRKETVLRFLHESDADILCLQEIKCLPDQFPTKFFAEAGWPHIEIAGMKAYHGAATISKLPLERLPTSFCPLDHARHVSTRVDLGEGRDFELHNFYVPAGGDIADPEVNDKFAHKLGFLENMRCYFDERFKLGDVHQMIVGDFNIAPHENDVWSSKQLTKVVSHTPLERGILEDLRASHEFIDTSRRWADDEEKLYSWWSYRAKDVMKSNRGRRLDHIWVSPAMAASIDAIGPDSHNIHVPVRIWEKPSDHVPMTQCVDVSKL